METGGSEEDSRGRQHPSCTPEAEGDQYRKVEGQNELSERGGAKVEDEKENERPQTQKRPH